MRENFERSLFGLQQVTGAPMQFAADLGGDRVQ